MVDPAERNKEIVEAERQRLRGLAKDYQPQTPTHSSKAQELTPEQERQDYRMARGTPGEFEMRLKDGSQKFGKVRAVEDILDWAIRNG